jgi:hypothetical protein
MKYDIKKRMFWKGEKPKKTTLSLSIPMWSALESLSKVTGESVPDLICKTLESMLVEMVHEGLIEAPEGETVTKKDVSQPLAKV